MVLTATPNGVDLGALIDDINSQTFELWANDGSKLHARESCSRLRSPAHTEVVNFAVLRNDMLCSQCAYTERAFCDSLQLAGQAHSDTGEIYAWNFDHGARNCATALFAQILTAGGSGDHTDDTYGRRVIARIPRELTAVVTTALHRSELWKHAFRYVGPLRNSDTPDVFRAAASLWEPNAASDLGTAAGAVEAARALLS